MASRKACIKSYVHCTSPCSKFVIVSDPRKKEVWLCLELEFWSLWTKGRKISKWSEWSSSLYRAG